MKIKISLLTILFALIELSNDAKAQTVTDIDGNVYNTVTIGTQTWFKENLKVSKYRNGDFLPQWAYNSDNNNVATYGRLYTWYASTDSRNVCPVGWHVPSDAEWTTLTDYLGGGNAAGGFMKEAGLSHWQSPNLGADNSSGFTALPGGYRWVDGSFDELGTEGDWWSVTESSAANAWVRYLENSNAIATRYSFSKVIGFSVRCLRDSSTTGLNESIKDMQFKLYPNPSESKFNISIANIITDKIVIEIYNLMGEKVLQQETSNEIDLSKSPKGIYFVKVYDGSKIYNQKIVLQ